jgi:predicted Zn-dependent protease
VIESPEVNAWCLPGGKIVVYSGLLSVTRNESSLAVVLGHEIAHALARHGNERMSRAMLSSGTQIVGNVLTAGHLQSHWIFRPVFDQASRLKVLLPNLRKQELEADKLGLTFTAVAGYDPTEAISLWRRMHRSTSGFAPPELLSTHPSEERRIRELKCFMPQTLKYLKR